MDSDARLLVHRDIAIARAAEAASIRQLEAERDARESRDVFNAGLWERSHRRQQLTTLMVRNWMQRNTTP